MTWAELHGVLQDRGLIHDGRERPATPGAGAISGVAYDSRQVAPGNVFVALKGLNTDGTTFAQAAIARGASAIVSEDPAPPTSDVAWAVVTDARLALAYLAAAFYRHPSGEMTV